MKRIILPFFFLFSLVLLGTGCEKINKESNSLEVQKEVVVLESERAEQAVSQYMKHTLGTIPNADINYDLAKHYLVQELVQKFDSPMFVLSSYCVKDSPTDVQIHGVMVGAGIGQVLVRAKYNEKWQEMWRFALQLSNGQWKISAINCLH